MIASNLIFSKIKYIISLVQLYTQHDKMDRREGETRAATTQYFCELKKTLRLKTF